MSGLWMSALSACPWLVVGVAFAVIFFEWSAGR